MASETVLHNETANQGDAQLAEDTMPGFITPARVGFALEAGWQIEACALAALKTLGTGRLGGGLDEMERESVLRALIERITKLAGVTADALNDDNATEAGMHADLFGAECH